LKATGVHGTADELPVDFRATTGNNVQTAVTNLHSAQGGGNFDNLENKK
jgi:hypothetical protein